MTNSAWAIDGQSDTAQLARQTSIAPLAPMGAAARPVGARSGVRFGSGVVATVTSTTWTVRPHVGIMDAQTAATAGPYGYAIDTAVTGAVTAAGASARTDALWIRIDDTVQDGSGATAVVPGYTASSSTAPARAMLLGTISVPASGGGAPTFTPTHPWLPTFIIPVRTQAERDALPVGDGVWVDRLDLNRLERNDGTTWRPYGVETWQGNEAPSFGGTPPAGTAKIRYSGSVTVMTTSGGGFGITSTASTGFAAGYPGLPNGAVSYSLTPGDTFSSLAAVAPILASSSLTVIFGIARDSTGAPIASRSIRVNWVAEGW